MLRILAIVTLLLVAAAAGLGLLSSYEPGVAIWWRIGYAVAGAWCLFGAVRLGTRARRVS